MTSTTFADQFDNSSEGFTVGERVRIISGEQSGSYGEIISVMERGYYAVEPENGGRIGVYDWFEIEALIEPVKVREIPPAPAYGMSSAALASEVSEAITRATGRVVGVGQDQYDLGSEQKFERMDLGDLIEGALEELDDVIVYSVMVGIRFRRIWDTLKDVT